jgi:hypothetical protein
MGQLHHPVHRRDGLVLRAVQPGLRAVPGQCYSQYPTLDVPYIHYNAATPDPNVTAYNCTIANENQFHTYGVDWTP